jgi:hypothetical protein
MEEPLNSIEITKTGRGLEIPRELPEDVAQKLMEIWQWAWEQSGQIAQKGLGGFERDLRDKMLELGGRVVEAVIPHAYGAGQNPEGVLCRRCRERSRLVSYRAKTITTLLKEVRLRRAYYYCEECGQGWLPLDAVLDVEGTTFSPAVREAICLVDAHMPFEPGQEVMERLSGVRVHADEGRRLAESLGERLEASTQEEIDNVWNIKKPQPREIPEAPERLYLSPDGTTVPTVTGWKEVKVGALFTTRIPTKGEEPVRERTRYVGTLETVEGFGKRLYVEALKMGLNQAKEVVVVADGAHWIWNEAEEILPKNRVEIIDFYHATEKLWAVARNVWGEENPKTEAWVDQRIHQLKKGRLDAVIGAMTRLRPNRGEAKKLIRQTLGYFRTNRHRMRYDWFQKKGYFIGSGVVESSCKHLVASRLKQAGMQWSHKGAQSILQLRLAWLNQRWDHLWLPKAA